MARDLRFLRIDGIDTEESVELLTALGGTDLACDEVSGAEPELADL